MRHLNRLAALGLASVLLAGCLAEPSASPSAATSTPTTTPPASSPASESASPERTPEPIPSADLDAFSCDLPVVEDATVARAQIVDVRNGTHVGYDRVVFEFADGLPEMTLDSATPPFTHDASGQPIDVEGASFLRLTMRGGTKQTEDSTSSYDGPTDFDPGLPMLLDLVEGGDFEAQSTWYLGLSAEACVRVTQLVGEGGPARLVIDVAH